MNKCRYCGASAQPNAKFCPKCGQPLKATTSRPIQPAQSMPAPATHRLTAPLSDQGRLADGAWLSNDRYEVVTCLEETGTRNWYVVKDLQVHSCPQCQQKDTQASRFCKDCGVPLTEYFYLLLEGLQPQAVEHEVRTYRFQLKHPGLVNLCAVFTEEPVGNHLRTYVLLDPVAVGKDAPGIQKATQLTAQSPIAPQQALAWLNDLVQTLDYLHSKQLWLPDLSLKQMILVGQKIKLSSIAQWQEFRPPEFSTVTVQEIRLLVQIWQALVGVQQLTPAMLGVLQQVQSSGADATPHVLLAALTLVLRTSQPVSHAWQLQVGCLTDPGLVRTNNEDSFYSSSSQPASTFNPTSIRLYAVADGMGGHAAGETASQLAIQHLVQTLLESVQLAATKQGQPAPLDYATLLRAACKQAAKAVYDGARKLNVDMGTTLVAALIDLEIGKVYIANVGDSRLYKLNRTQFKQISKDHSMVQLLVDKQQLTPEQARSHPQANLIYRTLGEKPVVEVDIFLEALAVGDYLLLCSDGLSGQVNDSQLSSVVLDSPTPQTACAELVKLARAAGAPDNVTVIIVKVERANGAQVD